jgi:hypothetical protein
MVWLAATRPLIVANDCFRDRRETGTDLLATFGFGSGAARSWLKRRFCSRYERNVGLSRESDIQVLSGGVQEIDLFPKDDYRQHGGVG